MTIKLNAATGGGSVSLSAPNSTTSNLDVALTLPVDDGTSGQVLVTDGTGTLSWGAGSQWTTSGSNIYYTTGSVGIGTTSPDNRLHIFAGDSSGSSHASAQLTIENSGNSALQFLAGTSSSSEIRFGDSGDNGAGSIAYVHSDNSLRFGTNNGIEKARIDSSGRLLVGTSTSSGFASARMIINSAGTDTTGSANLVLQVGEENSTISANEQIGSISFGDESGYTYATIQANADLAAGSDSPGRLVFSTTADGASSTTARMELKNDGGIRLFPNASQSVNLSSAKASGTTDLFFVGKYGATGFDSGTNAIIVYTNGNVVNANNSYGSLSDIKLKENIVDANSQWDDLKALQVRNYNFKEGQTHTQIGLIAQEVELVSPGLVTESPDRDKDGNDLGTVTKSVNYSVLYMKAVKALQEAMERIETLETANASLEARLTALEGGAS